MNTKRRIVTTKTRYKNYSEDWFGSEDIREYDDMKYAAEALSGYLRAHGCPYVHYTFRYGNEIRVAYGAPEWMGLQEFDSMKQFLHKMVAPAVHYTFTEAPDATVKEA